MAKRLAIGAKDLVVVHWPWVVGLAAASGLVLLRRRRGWRGPFTAGARTRPRDRSPIALAYDDAARALAKAGMPRDASVTPRELAAVLRERGAAAAAALAELTELYYAAEWGQRRDPAAEQRAAALAGEIRATLDAARRASR